MSIPYKEALLIKRTAWMNMQPRKHRPEDDRLVPIAVRMLTYIACLNYAMCDLEIELEDAGLLRHGIKRAFRIAQEHVGKVHQHAYVMLGKISTEATRSYNDQLDWMWSRIDNCILLTPPERAYNIVVALVRLIEKENTALLGRYDFAPARVLYKVSAQLACTSIEDRNIDQIIEMITK